MELTSDVNLRAIGFHQRQGSQVEANLDDAQGMMIAIDKAFSNGALLNAHYRHESQDVLQQFGRPVEGFGSEVEFFREEDDTFEILIPS